MHITLAIDLVDILIYGGIAVFVIGSWLWNLMRDAMQSQEATQHENQFRKSSLDEIAARRREELQRKAQQQRVQRQQASQERSPSNLTVSEHDARTKAKAEYERRAALLQEQQRQQQAAATTRQAPRPAQASRTATPSRTQRQVTTRTATTTPSRQQPHPPLTAAQRAAIQQRQAALLQAQQAQSREKAHEKLIQQQKATAQRRKSSFPGASIHTQQKAPVGMSISSLRRAVLYKEILDKPVALRSEPPGMMPM